MLQIAVCEDEKEDREYLVGMLESLLCRYVSNYRITSFSSGGGIFKF
ncbi:MAG: hypothetical protein NC118_16205 [Eubacterium sp.]|nr:hypothetical protein [Eubacterium sp.]